LAAKALGVFWLWLLILALKIASQLGLIKVVADLSEAKA